MSFLRTARAVPVGLRCLRGTVIAIVLVFLAALFVACGSGKLPAFGAGQTAYVTLPTGNSVLMLHIDGLTGVITTGAQTPQVTGTSPNGLALLSDKFLYVANSQANTISIFNVAGDGSLNLNGTPIPAGGTSPYAMVIDPTGKYLLVTNSSLSDSVSVFSIDSSTGALTAVSGSPFYANDTPSEIVIHPAGNLVYVTNPRIGTVTAFTFDNTTGVLTSVGPPVESGSGASGLAIDSSGRFLYVANTSAENPGSVAVGNISGFTINTTTGVLSPITGSPFTSPVGAGPSALVIDPSDRFVFATTAGGSYSLWCFAIDPVNGQLTAEPGSPYSVAAGTLFALIDTTGNFFYIGSQSANGIEAYTYNQNGVPALINNSPFSTGTAPGKMVIVP